MRVAVVTWFPNDPDAPQGGVEAVSVNLVRALSELEGLELHVVTPDAALTEVQIRPWENVSVHRLPRCSRRLLRDVTGPGRRQMRRYLLQLSPQIVHAHDTCGLLVKGLPIPRVFTVHGFIHADTRLSGRQLPRIRSWLWRRAEFAGWADQPHIISINPYVRDHIARVARGTIHEIDNPVAGGFFQVERREDKRRIFSAAAISPIKNTLGLLGAFARLMERGVDAELRLAGPQVSPEYAARVEAFIRRRDLIDRVLLLGALDASQIQEELAAAAVFVLASLQENAPMAIAEAMAAGVPVVTSNRCGMPHMITHEESGYLIDPTNQDDIARRLGQLLQDADLRARMGGAARRIAEHRFHPALVAQRTVEVYREAIRSGIRRNGRVRR
jgi:glycosyltransferase involved in cell wall biosynthesis